jgi:hypothetical protein
MKPSDLEDINWRDLTLFIRGYQKRSRDKWEQTRLLYWMQYTMNSADKKKKTPDQILPFVWDKKKERGKPISDDERLKMLKLYGNG